MNKFKIYQKSYIFKLDAWSFKGAEGVCVCVCVRTRAHMSRQAHMRTLLAGRLVPGRRDFQAWWKAYSSLAKLYAMQGQ